jgi:hypothetical protein
LILVVLPGCPQEQIETYRAPRLVEAPKGMPSAEGGEPSSIKYTVPAGWEPFVSNRGGIRAAAAFRVKEGSATAEVTVTSLGGTGGGLQANVNRWRQQIGSSPIEDDKELQSLVRPLQVAGKRADYVDLVNPDKKTDPGALRILGAIVPQGQQTWFIKMTGPSAVVEKHKAEFEKFVGSLSFGGGNHG